jgi:hypothetical protein
MGHVVSLERMQFTASLSRQVDNRTSCVVINSIVWMDALGPKDFQRSLYNAAGAIGVGRINLVTFILS